jgi:hypothetical protein
LLIGKALQEILHRTISGFCSVKIDNAHIPKLAYMRTLSNQFLLRKREVMKEADEKNNGLRFNQLGLIGW